VALARSALNRKPGSRRNSAEAIRARLAPLGGWDFDMPPREPMREPPSFDE
jgi:hypothetical protein